MGKSPANTFTPGFRYGIYLVFWLLQKKSVCFYEMLPLAASQCNFLLTAFSHCFSSLSSAVDLLTKPHSKLDHKLDKSEKQPFLWLLKISATAKPRASKCLKRGKKQGKKVRNFLHLLHGQCLTNQCNKHLNDTGVVWDGHRHRNRATSRENPVPADAPPLSKKGLEGQWAHRMQS